MHNMANTRSKRMMQMCLNKDESLILLPKWETTKGLDQEDRIATVKNWLKSNLPNNDEIPTVSENCSSSITDSDKQQKKEESREGTHLFPAAERDSHIKEKTNIYSELKSSETVLISEKEKDLNPDDCTELIISGSEHSSPTKYSGFSDNGFDDPLYSPSEITSSTSEGNADALILEPQPLIDVTSYFSDGRHTLCRSKTATLLENKFLTDVNNEVEDVDKSHSVINNKYKKSTCKFCDDQIVSKHFARHLERNHGSEREVKEIFSHDQGTTVRRQLIALIRNEGNLEQGIRGHIIPKKRKTGGEIRETDYSICMHCKAYYKRLSLSRHAKKCFAKTVENNQTNARPLTESLIYTSCHKQYGNIFNKLAAKKLIFSKMQADNITSIAMQDILIMLFGEDLLKKTKNKRSLYHISSKLRECGKFLLQMKQIGPYTDILSTLKPYSFDDAIEAIKRMSKYDTEKKTFRSASLALHFGTTLKKLSDLATKLILRKKIPLAVNNIETTLLELKRFKKIVESQWTTEIGSIALKDLNEKAAIKPKLLPITEDIMKLKNNVEKQAKEAYQKLKEAKSIMSYKTLAETTLILTVLHNRKRVGDIQYLELNAYNEQMTNCNMATVQTEMATSLSENEKILTHHYKRIISVGKGSRPVTILIPKNIQEYFNMIYSVRTTSSWFSNDNTYFFTYPKSTRWIDGCNVIRKYAKQCQAQHPELLTSCRLRKHIATVTQILSLKNNEIDQLAKFMGHTTKTHENFYKLPQDVYQVAKVSKILQLMEKGNVAQFKNKSLEEIDIDMENINDENGEDLEDAALDKGEDRETYDANTDVTEETRNDDFSYDNSVDDEPMAGTSTQVEDPDGKASKKLKNMKNTGGRQKWKETQKKIMRKYFAQNIKNKKALKRKECDEFLLKFKNEFEDVGWGRVKTFIFNEYRLK